MDCAPFKTDTFISLTSIKMNGPSLFLIFWSVFAFQLYYFGFGVVIIGIILNIFMATWIRERERRKKYSEIHEYDFYNNVAEGDVILVCRGGTSGESFDVAELYVYYILGTIMSGSIFGHVGQVFRDTDGILKVADVRFNRKNKNNSKHYICSVEDFVQKEYEGVKFWKKTKQPLTEEESLRLTKAVHTIGSQTGHCDDCFNPLRTLSTPFHNASPSEILEFGKRYGFGCAENISFIQRVADIPDAPQQRFVLPHHFADSTLIKIVN